MAGVQTFGMHHERYDSWFAEHRAAYVSELLALRPFVPIEGRGLEIGVGTGRFAVPLGIEVGVDPSPPMLRIASARGVRVVEGVAERLPFAAASFDHALVVTTICFVDRESGIGRTYEAHRSESLFYREATFFSADEVRELLEEAGFTVTDWAQTLAHSLDETTEVEAVLPGYGRCAFVVVTARNDA